MTDFITGSKEKHAPSANGEAIIDFATIAIRVWKKTSVLKFRSRFNLLKDEIVCLFQKKNFVVASCINESDLFLISFLKESQTDLVLSQVEIR